KAGLPGMVGAILAGERLVAIGADGVRKRGAPDAITIDDQIHIGSDTKAMTATLIGLLVEEGKLKWTTTVGEVFTDLSGSMQPDWRHVTLEQLLTHRGGAPANLDADDLWKRLRAHTGTPVEERRTLVEGITRHQPEAKPGTKFIYSNAGYASAGAMAEKVMGRAWEDLMRERLFAPLGMSSAGFGAPGTTDKLDQPRGHTEGGAPIEPGPAADNPAAIGPAGTVHCTIGDWAKFVALHLAGARGAARLLKPETFGKLQIPPEGGDYAMGWRVVQRDWAGGRALTHAGSNTLWFAVVWIAPEKNFAVLVACNQGGEQAAKACDEVVGALIQDHRQHP
ncbi:MAG TPA: serine hydrolase domain-containing protein, partial [Phycisphaerae bacterium]